MRYCLKNWRIEFLIHYVSTIILLTFIEAGNCLDFAMFPWNQLYERP